MWFRYEDLVLKTQETLARLFVFIGEKSAPTASEIAFEGVLGAGYGDARAAESTEIRKDRIGRWSDVNEDVQREVWGVAETVARRFGYSCSGYGEWQSGAVGCDWQMRRDQWQGP
jgi:hypothetical protein